MHDSLRVCASVAGSINVGAPVRVRVHELTSQQATVGVSFDGSNVRFTFGIPELLDGVNVVLVAVALFAVGETLFH